MMWRQKTLLNAAGITQSPRGKRLCRDQVTPTQYDFWGPVMPGGDNRAVMLMIKRGTAKVHHSDGCALHAPLVPLLREGEWHRLLGGLEMWAQPLPLHSQDFATGHHGRGRLPRVRQCWHSPQLNAQHHPGKPAGPVPTQTTQAVHARDPECRGLALQGEPGAMF